jgi:HAMP domain-containing protein
MNHETGTPRTDAAEPQLHSNAGGWVRADFARELELELTHSLENQLKTQAEVEELQQQKRNCIEILDDDAKEIAELKAEVERLRSQLERAIEIAEKIWTDCSNGSEHTDLAALKEEIK